MINHGKYIPYLDGMGMAKVRHCMAYIECLGKEKDRLPLPSLFRGRLNGFVMFL